MIPITHCTSLEEVRANIDRVDGQIVPLLVERGSYVKQAVRFKKTDGDVKASARVEQVIAKVTALSSEMGANPFVTAQVYRALITAFVDAEMLRVAHEVRIFPLLDVNARESRYLAGALEIFQAYHRKFAK